MPLLVAAIIRAAANYRVVHLVILKSNFGSFLFVASAAIALVGRTQRVVVLKIGGQFPTPACLHFVFYLLVRLFTQTKTAKAQFDQYPELHKPSWLAQRAERRRLLHRNGNFVPLAP